jgi:hypothetical protein
MESHSFFATESGSRRAKMTHKSKEIFKRRMFYEDFSYSLDVLYGNLGISKLHFFSAVNFSVFGHRNPVSGSGL